MPEQSPERLIRRREVEMRTGLKRSMLFRLMREGKFPKSIAVLGTRIRVWPQSQIDHWIDEQVQRSLPDADH